LANMMDNHWMLFDEAVKHSAEKLFSYLAQVLLCTFVM